MDPACTELYDEAKKKGKTDTASSRASPTRSPVPTT